MRIKKSYFQKVKLNNKSVRHQYFWRNICIIKYLLLFLAFILLGPLVFFLNLRNSSIIIRNGLLTNNISDGTRNYGWTEEMCYIRKAEAVTQLQVHSYYRSFPGKKAILIDFGKGNIKYIAADLFSKRQIKAILNILNSTI